MNETHHVTVAARKAASVPKTILKQLPPDPKGIKAQIEIWPITATHSNGVAIKLGGKAYKSKLCADKAAVLAFLNEVL